MDDIVFQLLNQAMPEGFSLEKDELMAIMPLFRYQKLKNNEIFYSPGQSRQETALILSGVMRHYLIDSRDREKTTDFCRAGEFTGTMSGDPENNTQFLSSVGVSELAVADSETLLAAAGKSLKLQKLFSTIVMQYFQLKTRREAELVGLEPAERYEGFIVNFPDLLESVPQYLIASYLGLTPETLSRIRGRRNRLS